MQKWIIKAKLCVWIWLRQVSNKIVNAIIFHDRKKITHVQITRVLMWFALVGTRRKMKRIYCHRKRRPILYIPAVCEKSCSALRRYLSSHQILNYYRSSDSDVRRLNSFHALFYSLLSEFSSCMHFVYCAFFCFLCLQIALQTAWAAYLFIIICGAMCCTFECSECNKRFDGSVIF